MRDTFRALAVCVLAVVLAVACSGGDEPDAVPSPTTAVQSPAPVASEAPPAPAVTTAPSATVAAAAPASTFTPEPASTAAPTPTVQPAPTAAATATSPAVPPASAVVVRKGPAGRRGVTLTFDAGADAGFTAGILDVLAAEGIQAAFGITGRWAEQNPGLMAAIAAAGHELINHTYDHGSFTGLSTSLPPLSQAARLEQLERTESIVLGLTGRSTRPYFRPPYGDYDDSVNRDVALAGYAYNVMWTVDSRGWQGIPAAEITLRCLSLAEPGAIYIFHVGSASQDAAALPAVIDGLRAAGYEFVPLSQMLP